MQINFNIGTTLKETGVHVQFWWLQQEKAISWTGGEKPQKSIIQLIVLYLSQDGNGIYVRLRSMGSVFTPGNGILHLYMNVKTCSAIWGLLYKHDDLRANHELLNTERIL